MSPDEVAKMLQDVEKAESQGGSGQVKVEFKKGDPIKIKEGPFENFEGTVDEIFPDKGVVRVIVTIFGRATPLELEYWQLEKVDARLKEPAWQCGASRRIAQPRIRASSNVLRRIFNNPQLARWQIALARIPRWAWIAFFIGVRHPGCCPAGHPAASAFVFRACRAGAVLLIRFAIVGLFRRARCIGLRLTAAAMQIVVRMRARH